MSHIISLGTYWAIIMVQFCLKHTAGNSLQPQASVLTMLAGHHLWDQSPGELKVFQGSPEQSWHDGSDPQQLPDDCMIQDVSLAHGFQREFHCQSCERRAGTDTCIRDHQLLQVMQNQAVMSCQLLCHPVSCVACIAEELSRHTLAPRNKCTAAKGCIYPMQGQHDT